MCSTTFKLRLSGITCTTSSLPHIFAWYNLHYLIATPDFFGMIYTSSSLPQIFSGAPDTPSGPHRKRGNLRRRYTSADTKSDELPPKIPEISKLKIPKTNYPEIIACPEDEFSFLIFEKCPKLVVLYEG